MLNSQKETLKRASTESVEARERLAWVETFRGMAILAVVAIHVSDELLPFCPAASPAWNILGAINRLFQFAVPAFLMLSTFLLTRSLLRSDKREAQGRKALKKYLAGRIRRVLRPYLLWSAVAVLFVWRSAPAHFHEGEALWRVLSGKSYFHLYFLGLLLQLSLLLPLLLSSSPLRRPSFWDVTVVTIVVTLGVYEINHWLWRLPFVGSFLLWHTPSVAVGMWLATQSRGHNDYLLLLLQRGVRPAAVIALVALLFYTQPALKMLRHENNLNTLPYQIAAWSFFSATGFLLLWVATRWKARWGETALQNIGRNSMQVYLLHPLVVLAFTKMSGKLTLLAMSHLSSAAATLFMLALMVFGCAIAVTLSVFVARFFASTRLSLWLFGQ